MKIRDIALLIVISTATAGTFLVAFPMLVWKGEIPTDALLEFTSILLSWPVAILILSLVFLSKFRDAIDTYIRNIKSFKLPGGVEVRSQAATPERRDEDGPIVTQTADEQAEMEAQLEELVQQYEFTEDARQQLEKAYEQANSSTLSWKFQYLNVHYVAGTKHVLVWFHMNPGQTKATYHQFNTPGIPQESEREAILEALINYGMLLDDNGVLRTTPEAVSFMQFLGLIPRV